jgi:DNA-binding transcriptional MerR regulator
MQQPTASPPDTAARDDRDGPALPAGAVARRLGVAVETLRSWERRHGLGPAAHRPGEHRRYSPADLRRLESFCRLLADGVPTAEAAHLVLNSEDGASTGEARPAQRAGGGALPLGRDGTPGARGLARCAARLDTPGVLELLDEVIARDGVAVAWEQTIGPALRAVGRKWTESGGRYVEVEHLLSWCATVALHRVRPTPGPAAADSIAARSAKPRSVLLACTPEEWHSLPLEALTAALTQQGAAVRMLGPAVPEPALCSAVARTGPLRVVLWSQTPRSADAGLLARLAAASKAEVLPAGPGWAALRGAGVRVLMSLPEAVEACCRIRARAGNR